MQITLNEDQAKIVQHAMQDRLGQNARPGYPHSRPLILDILMQIETELLSQAKQALAEHERKLRLKRKNP